MATASERLQACLAFTLHYEGGYQDRENDAGNWWNQRLIGTNMGISAPTLAAWVGPLVAAHLVAEDMRRLPLADARAIYASRYWNVVRGDDLAAGIDLMIFDFAVLAGPATSARIVQSRLGRIGAVTVDGFIGKRTLAALRAAGPRVLILDIADAQLSYLRGLHNFNANPGWAVRNRERQRRALDMAAGD